MRKAFSITERKPREVTNKVGVDTPSKKAYHNNREKEIAEKIGGVATPKSGAGLIKKGDITVANLLVDCKETVGSNIVVLGSDLVKVQKEARQAGKIPAFVITIQGIAKEYSNEWVMMPLNIMDSLLYYIERFSNDEDHASPK